MKHLPPWRQKTKQKNKTKFSDNHVFFHENLNGENVVLGYIAQLQEFDINFSRLM